MSVFIAFVLVAFVQIAQAQVSSAPMPAAREVSGWQHLESARTRGFSPFFGLSAGQTGARSGSDMDGQPAKLQVLGSYLLDAAPVVFEGGLGIFNQSFTSSEAPRRSVNGLALDAGVRYQTEDRWQFGVSFMNLFNRGESYSQDAGDARFVGLQALREFNLDRRYVARMGGRLLTDIQNDVPVHMVLLDLQIGWNPARKNVADKRVVFSSKDWSWR